MKYRKMTYGKGWAIKVTPEDRGADVLHFLITGGLLGGRSLDGVTWEEIENPKLNKLIHKRQSELSRSMELSK